MHISLRSRVFLAVGAFAFLGAVVFPFVSMGSSRHELYVDKNVSGDQDGSSAHPYKTIWQALDKADEGTDIFVAKGEYKENITIGKDIRVYGAGADKTTIKAKEDDDAVVTMKHKARLESVTVKGGDEGILVKEDSRANIVKVTVKDNDSEGILILKGDTDSDHKVSIVDSLIKENGKAGVYSRKRNVVVTDCTIQDNSGDGIVFEKDVTAWLENNTIKENKKSGIVAILDKSDIGIKKNSVYRNGREGMEISTYGEAGKINLDKSKFYENGRYGVARVSRSGSSTVWNGLTIQVNVEYWGNVFGSLSRILWI